MCRTTDFYRREDRLLRLKAVSIRLSLATVGSLLPDCLTLVFLPRINGGLLEVNGTEFRSDSPAFISLHRLVNSDLVFTSKDRVRACDGVVFEIHVAENRFLRGVLRQCDDDGVVRMECRCVMEEEFGVKEAEVFVAMENGGVLMEKVAAKSRRRRSCRRFEVALEEIPEERECDVVEKEEEGFDVACCCGCDEVESRSDGGDEVDLDEMMMETEIEGVRWAVDVGIWVVCLGVGLLVSRASARNLRRRKFLV